jgi:hypothetical protein
MQKLKRLKGECKFWKRLKEVQVKRLKGECKS